MPITYIKYLHFTNESINQNAIGRSSFIKPKLHLYVFTLQLLHVNSLHFNISIKKLITAYDKSLLLLNALL